MAQDLASYYFHQGTSTHAFDYLGVHRDGEKYVFRVWAPNAEYVSVVGDFNGWSYDAAPMTRITEAGIWEAKCDALEGQRYKYFIRSNGKELLKADPYGVLCELPPDTASIIFDISSYTWHDASFLKYRKKH